MPAGVSSGGYGPSVLVGDVKTPPYYVILCSGRGSSRGSESHSSHLGILCIMSACMPHNNDRVILLLQHLVDRVSGYMHLFTRYGWVRPLGCW